MSLTVSPLQSDLYAAVAAFLTSILPANTPVIQGLGNRASMPLPGFVSMTIVLMDRLRTNFDTWNTSSPAPIETSINQGVSVTMQIDAYGPNAMDWAAMITSAWRDDYGCQLLGANCAPLYADEARLVPLIDSEAQYEQRYSINAMLQYNPVTAVPMQFANTLKVGLIDVDEAYT